MTSLASVQPHPNQGSVLIVALALPAGLTEEHARRLFRHRLNSSPEEVLRTCVEDLLEEDRRFSGEKI